MKGIDVEARGYYLVRAGSNSRFTNKDDHPVVFQADRVSEFAEHYNHILGTKPSPWVPMSCRDWFDTYQQQLEMRGRRRNAADGAVRALRAAAPEAGA